MHFSCKIINSSLTGISVWSRGNVMNNNVMNELFAIKSHFDTIYSNRLFMYERDPKTIGHLLHSSDKKMSELTHHCKR